MGNRIDAEEVLQISWIEIFKSLKNYTDQGNLEGWMKTIVIRQAWKNLKKRKQYSDIENVSEPVGGSLDSQVFDKLTCDEILSILDYVSLGAREVFKLFVLDGYDHSEIAEMLNIEKSTSRAHLSKARKQLKEKFDELNKIAHNGLKAI